MSLYEVDTLLLLIIVEDALVSQPLRHLADAAGLLLRFNYLLCGLFYCGCGDCRGFTLS